LTGEVHGWPRIRGCVSTFEELDVPLFLHPEIPPKAVYDTYYSLPEQPQLSATFSLAGWGWHNGVAVRVLCLALSGVLDRHRKLKIVIGHQGEMMPMMMQRFNSIYAQEAFGFQRSVGEMLRSQVWIAISGLFTLPPVQAAISNWGGGEGFVCKRLTLSRCAKGTGFHLCVGRSCRSFRPTQNLPDQCGEFIQDERIGHNLNETTISISSSASLEMLTAIRPSVFYSI
jgi:hypothetical protein